jgi:hypothetical protein
MLHFKKKTLHGKNNYQLAQPCPEGKRQRYKTGNCFNQFFASLVENAGEEAMPNTPAL